MGIECWVTCGTLHVSDDRGGESRVIMGGQAGDVVVATFVDERLAEGFVRVAHEYPHRVVRGVWHA